MEAAMRYRVPGAAAYLGVSKSYLDKERAAGRGPAYFNVAGRIIYEQDDLDAYRRALRVEPRQTASSVGSPEAG
jgi:hypothetical protein